jgi:nitroreductase
MTGNVDARRTNLADPGDESGALDVSAAIDVFEVMETCRAMRYLKPDPIPDALIEKLVWAATRAPSPGNSQGWDFVLVTAPHLRAAIGDALGSLMAPRIETMLATNAANADRVTLSGALHLARTIGSAPLLVLVCGPVIYPPGRPVEQMTWSAIYPAAQNLILAARAVGLGSVFTTFHAMIDPLLRELLSIPDDVRMGALIPVGWPDRPFTPVRRRPVEDFIHRDGWQGDLRGP